MGVQKNVSYLQFPEQDTHLNREVLVCFKYDSEQLIEGLVVRDDKVKPFITIIRLNDGRHVLSTECQYRLK